MAKSGPHKRLCGAQLPNKPRGRTCTQRAGWGTDHVGVGCCRRHGGATESHERKARREIARSECDRLGVAVQIDPGDALIRELWEARGNFEFYRKLVEQLATHPEPDRFIPGEESSDGHWKQGEPGIYGPTRHVSGIPTGEAKPHVLVQMYMDERKHLVHVAKTCITVGIEERRVKLAEDQGRLIADILTGVLTELGVMDRPEVPTVVRRHLALAAGS